MYTIRKLFKFEAAHQLLDSYSVPCQNLHGHSYLVEVILKGMTLDSTGMVVDFGMIKDTLKVIIDEFDHSVILYNKMDEEYLSTIKKFNKDVKIVDWNPTAENMAKYFYERIEQYLLSIPSSKVSKVRVHETTTGWAEYGE